MHYTRLGLFAFRTRQNEILQGSVFWLESLLEHHQSQPDSMYEGWIALKLTRGRASTYWTSLSYLQDIPESKNSLLSRSSGQENSPQCQGHFNSASHPECDWGFNPSPNLDTKRRSGRGWYLWSKHFIGNPHRVFNFYSNWEEPCFQHFTPEQHFLDVTFNLQRSHF